MNTKYKQKTRCLGIPVPWYGDNIIPEQEMKKYQIIENMILAATQGVQNVVFDDGSYAVEKEADGRYRVVLRATGPSPSAEGISNGVYFQAPSTVVWSGLKQGGIYNLYLQAGRKTYEDCSAVRAVSSAFQKKGLLMATVDLNGDVGSINKMPDGKVYSADSARHSGDRENPHGVELYQDSLTINEKLVLGADAAIVFGGQRVTSPQLLDAICHVAGHRIQLLDLTSPGPEGEVVEVKEMERVSFVQVQRKVMGALNGTVGDIGIGYYGENPDVNLPNEFAIYNSGDEGIPLKAMILCM
jgi:hypothetical protein